MHLLLNKTFDNLQAKLLDLLERIKFDRNRAPPVCRAYTSKADGSQGNPAYPSASGIVLITCHALGRRSAIYYAVWPTPIVFCVVNGA
jgi:hypothetical protein